MKGQKFIPRKGPKTEETSKFKTDSDISKSKFKERELQKWVPEAGDSEILTFDESADTGAKWDQFKANQDKFGIGTTYDEHLYTTRINTEAEDYQERVKRAEQLAKEIENEATNDPHILEERGLIDTSELDEEMKYSGVLRDDDTAKKDTRGDELMAALKSVNINDQKNVPAKPQGMDEHKDPAIASVSDKKPVSIPSKPILDESFRLNAQSEINSLKEFSATFKVPHKLPNDLLPILAKDKLKQDEILKKSSPQASSASLNASSPRKKMDPTKPAFKLNPKAAIFTPASSGGSKTPSQSPLPNNTRLSQSSSKPQQPKAPYSNNYHNGGHNNRLSPNNPSPRMNNQRPYSGSSNGPKRHYQISPSDFFGGADKVPTKESQVEKAKKFKTSFNLFVTAKVKTSENESVQIERAYITPPTWDQTIDEPYYNLFPSPDSMRPSMPLNPSPFMQSPMMVPPGGMMAGGFPPQFQPPTSKPGSFLMSPQQASPQLQGNAQFAPPSSSGTTSPQPPSQPGFNNFQKQQQQQQMQAAMFYQQQFGMMPPGQPPIPGMYVPNGGDFFVPGYMPPPVNYSGGSPNSPRMMMYNQGHNSPNHQYGNNGNRRFSQRRNDQ